MREAIAALAAAIHQASSGGETGNLEVDTKYRVENSTGINESLDLIFRNHMCNHK